jgi:hypothetical protein
LSAKVPQEFESAGMPGDDRKLDRGRDSRWIHERERLHFFIIFIGRWLIPSPGVDFCCCLSSFPAGGRAVRSQASPPRAPPTVQLLVRLFLRLNLQPWYDSEWSWSDYLCLDWSKLTLLAWFYLRYFPVTHILWQVLQVQNGFMVVSRSPWNREPGRRLA